MNLFVTQLALIFFPGIIWAAIDSQYASRKEFSQFRLIVSAFVFGTISYAVVYLLYSLTGFQFDLIGIVDEKTKDSLNLHNTVDEIISAVVVSLGLSILWVYAATYKLFNKFLHSINATKRYGDEDVWDYVFNSKSAISEFINIRDFEKEIVYAGYVLVFSEAEKLRELVLRDAEVYDFSGTKLFSMPHIYIARDPKDVHIEFPYKP